MIYIIVGILLFVGVVMAAAGNSQSSAKSRFKEGLSEITTEIGKGVVGYGKGLKASAIESEVKKNSLPFEFECSFQDYGKVLFITLLKRDAQMDRALVSPMKIQEHINRIDSQGFEFANRISKDYTFLEQCLGLGIETINVSIPEISLKAPYELARKKKILKVLKKNGMNGFKELDLSNYDI